MMSVFSSFTVLAEKVQLWEPVITSGSPPGSEWSRMAYLWCSSSGNALWS